MVTVSTIAVNLSAQTAQFEAGMNKAKHASKDTADVILHSFAHLAAGFSLGNMFNDAIHGLQHLVHESFETGIQLGHLSQRLGISAAELAGLQLAAKRAGVESDDFTANLQRLEKNIGLATLGSGELSEKFDKLGLDAKHLADLPLVDALKEISNAIGQTENKYERAAMATEIFGKSGMKVMGILRSGSEELRKSSEDAKRFGTALSEHDIENFEHLHLAIVDLKEAASGAATVFAGKLAPAISAVTNKLAEMASQTNKLKMTVSDPGGNMQKITDSLKHWPMDLSGVLNRFNFDPGFSEAEVAKVFETTKTAAERLNGEIEKLDTMLMFSAIDVETYDRAIENLWDSFQNASPLHQAMESLRSLNDQLGKTDRQKALDKAWNLGGTHTQLREINKIFDEMDAKTKALEVKKFATDLIEATATPLEKFDKQIKKLKEAFDNWELTPEQFDRGLADATDKLKDLSEKSVQLGGPTGFAEAGTQDAFRALHGQERKNIAEKTLADILREQKEANKLQREANAKNKDELIAAKIL